MDFGRFLSDVGYGMGEARKQAGDARAERVQQLFIEEQNRLADMNKQLAGMQPQFFTAAEVPQFNTDNVPSGMPMPMERVNPTVASAAAVQPSAPVAPTAQPTPSRATQPAAQPKAVQPPKPKFQSNAATPLGRWWEEFKASGSDAKAKNQEYTSAVQNYDQQRQAVIDKFGARAGLLGGLMVQDREQRANAIAIMDALDNLSAEDLSYVLANDKLPTPKRPSAKAPTPQAPKAPVNPAAAQYDNARTPYDDIINRSAQQYGLDPVMFKRLIGTESSFNPTAVSPRGESFGLGIAQISQQHPLTREQKLDPNTAIPYAAKLFSQYLNEAGGDQVRALQKYKGAVSEQGKAAMAKPIGLILSGSSGEPRVVTPPATLETPKTSTRNMEMADYYLANPQAVPYEMQQVATMWRQQAELLTRQRNQLAQLAQIYAASNTTQGRETAQRLMNDINQMDTAMLSLQQQVQQKQLYLQGMQGVRELSQANDPRRLASVLTQYLGSPVGIQPRSDGTYNYFVNGRKVQDGMTADVLARKALLEFSPDARASASASAALENKLALEQKYGSDAANALASVQKAIIEGEYGLAKERAKNQKGDLTVDTNLGLAYYQLGNNLFIIDAKTGNIQETKSGPVNIGPVAKPVAGLNLGM